MKLDTTNIKRKNPINRNNFFFSSHQFDVQNAIAMEYVNKMVNQTVILYQIDRPNTKMDDIYFEANYKDVAYKTPIELNVRYKIDKAEFKTYDSESIKAYFAKVGQLTFNIFEKELEENDCDINRGDIIGVQITPEHMEFFKVADDGRVNFDNSHTLYGFKPYYRSVTCAPVDDITETMTV